MILRGINDVHVELAINKRSIQYWQHFAEQKSQYAQVKLA